MATTELAVKICLAIGFFASVFVLLLCLCRRRIIFGIGMGSGLSSLDIISDSRWIVYYWSEKSGGRCSVPLSKNTAEGLFKKFNEAEYLLYVVKRKEPK